MKNLVLLASLVAVSLGFSSCCSMFGAFTQNSGYRTETRQVKTCRYDIVTKEVVTPGDSKSGKGGMVETVEGRFLATRRLLKRSVFPAVPAPATTARKRTAVAPLRNPPCAWPAHRDPRQPEYRSHSYDEAASSEPGGCHTLSHSTNPFPRRGESSTPRAFLFPILPVKRLEIRQYFPILPPTPLPINIMSVNIEMPKLSDTMTEGTLIKWHKKIGDSVEIGDILAEIETDKATMEMEAFDDGIITEILIQEGERAPIGGILAVLDGDSEAPPIQAPQAVSSAPTAPVQTSVPAVSPIAPVSGERLKVSPLARKVAADLGVNLTGICGSGPAGRIVKSDIQAAASSSPKVTVATSFEASATAALAASIKSKATIPSAPNMATAQAIIPVAKEGDERIELSSMRKIIASRLLTSKTTIPHFYLHLEVDAAPLMELRKQVNAQAEKTHGNKYSVNDFILKAVINATQAVPRDERLVHRRPHHQLQTRRTCL